MDIIDLKPDELIQANGFYRMPLERHHGQPCDGVSVTSGVLRQMELATPADVWAFHKLNPNRWEREETDALRLGVAMALYVEGGAEAVLTGFRVHPEDKPRKPTAAQVLAVAEGRGTEAAIASVTYWAAVDADPHGYLTKDEFESICTAGAVLAQDPSASAVMGGSMSAVKGKSMPGISCSPLALLPARSLMASCRLLAPSASDTMMNKPAMMWM